MVLACPPTMSAPPSLPEEEKPTDKRFCTELLSDSPKLSPSIAKRRKLDCHAQATASGTISVDKMRVAPTVVTPRTIRGNLFKCADLDGFCGIVNTATVKPHGFTAAAPRDLGKWCDPYGHRTAVVSKAGNLLNLCVEAERYKPGSIVVQTRPGNTGTASKTSNIQYALWIVGQIDMSTPGRFQRFPSVLPDTKANRELWFANGLNELGKWVQQWSFNNDNRRFRLGMAKGTGSGLAGGSEAAYHRMMLQFYQDFSSVVELIWFEL